MIRQTEQFRSGARALLAGALLAALYGPAAALEAAQLVSGAQTLRVVSAERERTELPLEPGVRFSAVATLDDGWVAAGVRDGDTLLMVRSGSAGAEPERLATPAPGGRGVAAPLPLAADGRLLGVVWLSGDGPRTFAVRFAPWQGDGWGPVETVAGPGPGSQLAPAAALVDGGDLVVLWSAFDGVDDEILWSRRSNGEWSPPDRVADDNRVPDITPAVAVVGGRAVAAWSRYDGRGYTLMVSRLEDGGWTQPTPVAGSGSLYPSFEPVDAAAGTDRENEILLIFRDAPAQGWTVLRLDRELRPRARAFVAAGGRQRPVVLGTAGHGLEVLLEPDGPPERIAWTPVP